MSSFLYSLGQFCFRRRGIVLISWVLILGVIGGAAAMFSRGFEDSFTIPGTESQEALDSLEVTLPQMAYSSATIIVVAPEGESMSSTSITDAVAKSVDALAEIPHVDSVQNPFDSTVTGLINDAGTAALIAVQLDVSRVDVSTETTDAISAAAAALQEQIPGSTVTAGGDAYGITGVSLGATEAIGAVIALLVLALTFGSLIAAAIPLTTALLGVGISAALIVLATAFSTISSTTPILAIMLGLAVGIDYALFILSRYRAELGQGRDPMEAAGIAVATAGSAVVFAGMTVIIALVGLFVANIPFLTVMGVAAAIAVAIAVVIALTLLPALMGVLGPRLRPRSSRRTPGQPAAHPFARRWVGLVTRVPAVTILIIVVGLGALALPARDLQLALPTNGDSEPGTAARTTYDLIDEYFGPGQNAPLLLTGSIIESTDPVTLVDEISAELSTVDGVDYVALATPNANADTAIFQLVPTTGASDPETADLVSRLRDLAPQIEQEYGVDLQVTGVTALQIDVSQRLADALIPFGLFVVGLSLVLLTIIFRSIWVPLKATLGYLLSVAAAFGVTTLVFEYGWFNTILNVEKTGPVISFMPIILMGVLFGLAMDYEVFLVSRMREDFVHTGDARAAVRSGFLSSAQVVTAAAVIMFFVFAAFVPQGEGAIKAIALGLAVGVFVDAFIVRMSLVPAVLTLLGAHAWWLPRWLDRWLPHVDVEGSGVAHIRELASWPADGSVIAAEGLTKLGPRGVIVAASDLRTAPGEVVVLRGPRGSGKSARALMLSGRMPIDAGSVTVCGFVLPEQAGSVRRRCALIPCRSTQNAYADVARAASHRGAVIMVDDLDTLRDPAARQLLHETLTSVVAPGSTRCAVVTLEHLERAADVLTGVPIRVVELAGPGSQPRPSTVLTGRI